MKAIRPGSPRSRICMQAIGLAALASCAGQPVIVPPPAPRPAPQPAPRPAPVPMPAPTPTPAPPPRPAPPAQTTDWTRAPLTLGDWKWSLENGQSVARFGGGVLVLRCNLSARTIELSRSGAVDGQTPLTVLTSALTRTLSASPATGPAATQVTLAASDPLLDAMAFSRGRFAIETPGLPRLVVPSWTEVSRVVEDCR